MTRKLTIATTQMHCSWDIEANLIRAEQLVRDAAAQGAKIILLQELFATPYFCQDEDKKYFELAETVGDSALIKRFSALAKALQVVLPLSFFERDGSRYFNSLVVIDADGECVAHYRKIHIPEAPGYYETFYFESGDKGFCVADTRYGRIGVGVCWDQWFPEAARIMALAGAEILFYPTAIGSEPSNGAVDSRDHWRRVMQGHAAANLVPVVAANRVGTESGAATTMTFYGSGFIADNQGALLAATDRTEEGVCLAEVDLDAMRQDRNLWGIYQTRQVAKYGAIADC